MPTETRSSNTDPRDVFIRLNPLGLGEAELRKDSTGFEDQRTHSDYLLFLAGYRESQPPLSDLIEVKTANLIGEQLAWAVGKAEGLDVRLAPPGYNGVPWRVFVRYTGEVIVHDARFDPYENWAVGGPLIDRHHGSAQHFHGLAEDACYSGGPAGAEAWSYGPTALVAFCRGLVHYKLGDTVLVPKELMP